MVPLLNPLLFHSVAQADNLLIYPLPSTSTHTSASLSVHPKYITLCVCVGVRVCVCVCVCGCVCFLHGGWCGAAALSWWGSGARGLWCRLPPASSSLCVCVCVCGCVCVCVYDCVSEVLHTQSVCWPTKHGR